MPWLATPYCHALLSNPQGFAMLKRFSSQSGSNISCLSSLVVSALCAASTAHAQPAAPPQEGLSVYFPAYAAPVWLPPWRNPPPVGFPPEVRVNGGGVDPPPLTNGAGSFYSVDRFVVFGISSRFGVEQSFVLSEFFAGTCLVGQSARRMPRRANESVTGKAFYVARAGGRDCQVDSTDSIQEPFWTFNDRYTSVAPARRKAIDGSEYEAAALAIERDGVPWMTYFAGYRLAHV
jgi:hypothetical protein